MKRAPSSTDRMIDIAALLLVAAGVGLFAFARVALTGIGNGSRVAPEGMSAVAVADFHVAQSSLALGIVVLGVLLGIVAAVRHRISATGSPG